MAPAADPGRWHAVPQELLGDDAPPIDLYIRIEGQFVLYYATASLAWDDARQRFREHPVQQFWVTHAAFGRFQDYLAQRIMQVAADPALPPVYRGQLLRETCSQALRESFARVDDQDAFERAHTISRNTIDAISTHPEVLPGVGLLIGHHYDTFSHCVQVAALAAVLAPRVHLADQEAVTRLGLGAMFHDIGKSRVPGRVLDKTGPLSDAEWAVMQRHPGWGADILRRFGAPDINPDAVRHHHERFDGAGYPDRLRGDAIPLEARIVKVTDVFHAVTSNRAYRSPLEAFPAVKMMRTEMHDQFDLAVLDEFVLLLGSTEKVPTLKDAEAAALAFPGGKTKITPPRRRAAPAADCEYPEIRA